MTKNEIKKLLYKHNPIAKLVSVTRKGVLYGAVYSPVRELAQVFTFRVDLNDISTGGGKFFVEMDRVEWTKHNI